MTRRANLVAGAVLATVALAALSFLVAGEKTTTKTKTKMGSIKYRTIQLDRFQSFIKNWDFKNHPLLYARISKPEEWDAVFAPAPVMGPRRRPFAPEKKLYEKEQLLVVARVVKAPDENELNNLFQVQKVTADDEELVLRYRFRKPNKADSYTAKHGLAILVPKYDYKRVKFVENGKPVGNLNLAKGQWSVPETKSGHLRR